VAVLKHESLHVAHRHFERLIDVSQKEIATVAKEISINQYIEGLPDKCLTVEQYGLDRNLSLEDYYKKLLEKAKEDPEGFAKMKGDNPLDGDADELGHNAVAVGDKICSDAKDYAKGIGKDTGDLYEKIQIVPTNYKAKINKLIGCQPSCTEIKKTNSRRSKRFARSPGIKKLLQLGPAIMGLDTSGSMSKDELAKAIDVAKKLRKKCSNVWLIQGDTEVTDINKVSKNIRELEVKGRGGTELTPIIEKAKEFGYPKIPLIMFTDGEIWNYPSHKELKNSVWIFTQEETARQFHEKRPGIDYAVLI
jgi:predicted metal-dependent peptidase